MITHEIKRLHWGCGGCTPVGWINSDVRALPGVNLVCDIHNGLSLDADSINYCVSVHALQEMTLSTLLPALKELRRVLKPGGVLRLVLPDIDKGIAAYQRRDNSYFLIPDEDAKSIGAKFITQMLWYGYSKLLFTGDFIEEKLLKAGFSRVVHCEFKQSASPWPEIVELDNRESESLYVEAVK
jgi:predicted SAM-dependent methyltransferase